MKYFYVFLISFSLVSCEESKKNISEHQQHIETHKEIDKIDNEIINFRKQLVSLYSISETHPDETILKIDSLIVKNKDEKDKYKSSIKKHVNEQLHHLKAEIFYKIGEYKKSMDELNNRDYEDDFMFNSHNRACLLAANYLKLQQYDKAKSFIDSIRTHYIDRYAIGNYYESIGNKEDAIKIYEDIKLDKTIKHYAFYKLAVDRYFELQKKDSKLLNEIFCPPNNPNYIVADSDSENRNKIFEIINKLPEVKECRESKDCNSTWIYESPQINDKDYYWIKVGNGDSRNHKKKFNFFIYVKTFEVKYYDVKSNKILNMDEWRKMKNGI